MSGKERQSEMKEEWKVTVSPVCTKDGKQYAYVSFSDGMSTAEGRIPDCKIISNKGFGEAEVLQLEQYMKRDLGRLKKTAANIRVLDAFMK